MKHKSLSLLVWVLGCLLVILFILNIFLGSVHIPAHDVLNTILSLLNEDINTPPSGNGGLDSAFSFIVLQHRFPQAVTALMVGAALSVAGLLLQTTFHNPLAGPGVLGISGGASLGVAILMLGGIAHSVNPGDGMVVIYLAAFIGAFAVTALLLFLSSVIKSNLILLIVGLLLGYLISAIITILYVVASPAELQNFVIWGMGDFSSVSLDQLRRLVLPISTLLILSLLLIKPLNALQLGDIPAQNLGVNIRGTRNWILLIVGGLIAISTAYCGPVSFLGLAVPHITRLFVKTTNYRILLPTTILMGSVVALFCNLLCCIPSSTLLPLNAVTPLIGVPVIVYVVIKKR